MAQKPSSKPSILDAVGQSILDAASSLDANIDASSLVERLSKADDVGGRQSQRALSEMKDLVRRAPEAVVAAPGAISGIIRVVSRLAQRCGNEEQEDDGLEALQDALETLGLLLGDAATQQFTSPKHTVAESPSGQRAPPREDPVAARRGKEIAELIIMHTENGKDLLKILNARDVSTQYDGMCVLQRIFHRTPEPITKAFLAEPMALNNIMRVLQSCNTDYVRNESLGLLLLLTASSGEIQQIVTMQGLPETVCSMLEEEDLGVGGRVARDLIRCLYNLCGSSFCRRCIVETGCLGSLVSIMTAALLGQRLGEAEEEDEDFQASRLEVPDEARWACFLLLADVALLLGGGGASQAGRAGEPQPEFAASRDALIRHGALDLLQHLSDPRISIDGKLRLVRLLEVVEPSALAAKRLESVLPGRQVPLLSVLASMLLGHGTPPELKNALGRVLCRCIARHPSLQITLFASLSPQMEMDESSGNGEESAGQLLVQLLERTANGRVDPPQLWFAMHLLLAMMLGNASVQGALPAMRIASPGGDSPAEFCQDLLFAAFSGCARKCLDKASREASADSQAPSEAAAPAAALMAALKLFIYWLASCSQALAAFAGSPVMVPCAMNLIVIAELCGPFWREQVEGLASLLMGICIKAEQGRADGASLMSLVAERVGIEEYQRKVERILRSETLLRPARALVAFRWYNARFRTFMREQHQAVQRRMVQLYVKGGVGGDSVMHEDIADQYKQLIRVQDEKFREVQKENEGLRVEVEAFMRRSLQASSSALAGKMEALRMENEALHAEVEQAAQDAAERTARLEQELQRSRACVSELEQQSQSMAIGYEQVERTSESLRIEAARLRRELAEVERARPASQLGVSERIEALSRAGQEAEESRQRIEELTGERADLLELLGCVVAAVPEAARFVAPLGHSASLAGRAGLPMARAEHPGSSPVSAAGCLGASH